MKFVGTFISVTFFKTDTILQIIKKPDYIMSVAAMGVVNLKWCHLKDRRR